MNVDGQALFKRGISELESGNVQEADSIFNFLLNKDIDSDALHFYIASTNMKKGNNGLSILLFRQILNKYPQCVEAVNNIGYCYKQENHIDKAREQFQIALDMLEKDPKKTDQDKLDYLTNIGSTYVASGDPQKVISILDKAIAIDPENPVARWNRSLAYLEMGDYEKGFRDYDYDQRIERTKNRHYGKEPTPFWDGTPGQTIAIFGEQGIGDELMFASILPDVMKDCEIILDVHPRLVDIFRLNFPNTTVYGTRKTPDFKWGDNHKIDAKIAMGSLGKFYRKKKEHFPGTPYLKANPELVNKYKTRLLSINKKPKVGLSWKGGTLITNKHTRSIPLELMLPLFDCDVEFISLQYNDDAQKEVDIFSEKTGKSIHHWSDVLKDYDETAALVSSLDFIISVPQSVVHLAGALGAPTLQLCPKQALWQMGVYGENMPWYSCVENIWQDSTCEWQPVINKAKEKLCNLLQMSIAA